MKALKSDIDIDIARESSQIDELINSVQSISLRLSDIETMNTQSLNQSTANLDPLNNNDITVIVKQRI